MILNHSLLRSRRIQLGLSCRQLAVASGVTTTVIFRVEKTGDATLLQVKNLTSILQNLSLDLTDVLPSTASRIEEALSPETCELAQMLFQSKRAISKSQIARTLSITLEQVDFLLACLDSKLRHVGLRTHQNTDGMRLVLGMQSENLPDVANTARRARTFGVLNIGDLSLLFKAMSGALRSNNIMGSVNGKVSLHKLTNAGLVEIDPNGLIVLTAGAFLSLGYDSMASKEEMR